MKSRFWTAFAVLVMFIAPTMARAQAYLATDNLGYTGTLSCYASLAEAVTRSNATCSNAVPQRDLGLYFVDNNPVFAGSPTYPNSSAIFVTNWYSNGGSNPNNNNVGFVQMYDDGAGSVTSMSMGWQNASRTTFGLEVSGGPTIPGCGTIPPQDCGRLWDGAVSANGGIFASWTIDAMFSGFASATWNPLTGVYESVSEPTTVSGTITGVFTDGVTGNFYALDAELNMVSWAVENGHGGQTVAGGDVVTPEPVTMTLIGTGLAGIAAARRRRKSAMVQ